MGAAAPAASRQSLAALSSPLFTLVTTYEVKQDGDVNLQPPEEVAQAAKNYSRGSVWPWFGHF